MFIRIINFVKNMKKTALKKEEYEIKWWEDWLEADIIEKEEMVYNLPALADLLKLKGISKDMRRKLFARNLNYLFQDLQNAMCIKIANEKTD